MAGFSLPLLFARMDVGFEDRKHPPWSRPAAAPRRARGSVARRDLVWVCEGAETSGR